MYAKSRQVKTYGKRATRVVRSTAWNEDEALEKEIPAITQGAKGFDAGNHGSYAKRNVLSSIENTVEEIIHVKTKGVIRTWAEQGHNTPSVSAVENNERLETSGKGVQNVEVAQPSGRVQAKPADEVIEEGVKSQTLPRRVDNSRMESKAELQTQSEEAEELSSLKGRYDRQAEDDTLRDGLNAKPSKNAVRGDQKVSKLPRLLNQEKEHLDSNRETDGPDVHDRPSVQTGSNYVKLNDVVDEGNLDDSSDVEVDIRFRHDDSMPDSTWQKPRSKYIIESDKEDDVWSFDASTAPKRPCMPRPVKSSEVSREPSKSKAKTGKLPLPSKKRVAQPSGPVFEEPTGAKTKDCASKSTANDVPGREVKNVAISDEDIAEAPALLRNANGKSKAGNLAKPLKVSKTASTRRNTQAPAPTIKDAPPRKANLVAEESSLTDNTVDSNLNNSKTVPSRRKTRATLAEDVDVEVEEPQVSKVRTRRKTKAAFVADEDEEEEPQASRAEEPQVSTVRTRRKTKAAFEADEDEKKEPQASTRRKTKAASIADAIEAQEESLEPTKAGTRRRTKAAPELDSVEAEEEPPATKQATKAVTVENAEDFLASRAESRMKTRAAHPSDTLETDGNRLASKPRIGRKAKAVPPGNDVEVKESHASKAETRRKTKAARAVEAVEVEDVRAPEAATRRKKTRAPTDAKSDDQREENIQRIPGPSEDLARLCGAEYSITRSQEEVPITGKA
ncbi:hypothetical protein HDU96_011024 [Phlyctochytrium bullatum]|nr:hypothetical protein HDU96_011024 [Phlyctochytrium bullatum]